jgi:hypothetical protein
MCNTTQGFYQSNMNVYQLRGYTDRLDYLKSLAENNDVPLNVVISVAELFGESEDFDGLVSAIQDYQEIVQ